MTEYDNSPYTDKKAYKVHRKIPGESSNWNFSIKLDNLVDGKYTLANDVFTINSRTRATLVTRRASSKRLVLEDLSINASVTRVILQITKKAITGTVSLTISHYGTEKTDVTFYVVM